MEEKSKVFILTDAEGRIIRLDGGYTIAGVDTDTWICIDEGFGDRYNLCQTHYLPNTLFGEHGIPRYKFADGEITERTAEEIQADIDALPHTEPNNIEQRLDDIDAALEILISGRTE